MRQIPSNTNLSKNEITLTAVQRLVAYEEAKANGRDLSVARPANSPTTEHVTGELACIDLLHRVWPDFDQSPAVADECPPPKTLGDFRVIRELGRGGMGTVFEAEQMTMGRRVALKVLPFAALANEKSLQRFRNEVRAAAALDHPHIVSVYSIGEERGIHFYAMQLIRGQTLADMITELRRNRLDKSGPAPNRLDEAPTSDSATATPPSTQCVEQVRASTAPDSGQIAESFRAAAQLGIQAAEALQHAHDMGVLHRDIKPSNLMLDGDGELYITDFGLARIEADAGMTMTGDIIGTLRYMAPEQALAKRVVVDQRADVYSLGATLYELLALQPAFADTDRSELLKKIAMDEPQPLRKVNSKIPLDLETIVLKAMAKGTDDRYQSADRLAEDLLAYLEHKPISARPPTIVDRIRRLSRRHPATLRSAAVLLMMMTIGSMAAAVLIWRANQRAASALASSQNYLQQAALQKQAAEQSAAESQAVVDFLTNDLLSAAKPTVDKQNDLSVKQALNIAAERVESAFVSQPAVEVAVRIAIGRSYQSLGDFAKARDQFQLARERAARDLGEQSVASLTVEYNFARLLNIEGRLLEANFDLGELLEVAEQRLGTTHPLTVAIQYQLGNNERRQGNNAQAIERLEFVLNEWGRSQATRPESVLAVMGDLAMAKWFNDDILAAEQLAQEQLRLAKQIFGTGHMQFIIAQQSLVRIPSPLRSNEFVCGVREDVVAAYCIAYGKTHYKTREAMHELASTYQSLGRDEDAAQLAIEAESR